MKNKFIATKIDDVEKVTRSCYGYLIGPLYTYTTECGNVVETHHKYCHQCGKKLVFVNDK